VLPAQTGLSIPYRGAKVPYAESQRRSDGQPMKVLAFITDPPQVLGPAPFSQPPTVSESYSEFHSQKNICYTCVSVQKSFERLGYFISSQDV
jgi:hypothetical protein